ncbi:MAG: hypothetical protein ACFFE5_03635 [Candidatus Thorarchaeota archaeon]
MRKYYLIFKTLILIFLIIISTVIIYNFFYYNLFYADGSLEVSFSWMLSISYFILFFYILLFLLSIKIYVITFSIIVIFGTPAWIIIYALETFVSGFWFPVLTIIRHLSAIISFSILSPGLTLIVIRYIKNNSNRSNSKKLFHNYHFHEGFLGIIFILISILLIIIRYLLVQYEIFRRELRVFLAIDMVLLYLFLFFGSFLIFRDWRDLLRFKIIEKREIIDQNYSSAIFYPLTPDSIKFFKSPKIIIYPIGVLLSSIAVNIFIHGNDFFPEAIFNVNHETLVLVGIILSFFAGGIVGLDWYRLFAKIYPEEYMKFEQILENLRNNN